MKLGGGERGCNSRWRSLRDSLEQRKMEEHNFGSILALEASSVQGLVTELAKELEARARA